MAKFAIECPHCGAYNNASTSIFASKKIECKCGKIINVKKERMSTMLCPHCKNTVVYDQAKGKKAICPVCGKNIISDGAKRNVIEINCPSCACELIVDKNAAHYECPLCETKIDVQAEIKKQEIKKDGLVSVIKYEGPNDVFVWKHPIEDFNLGSQLIVHESQEALFFKDGRALDLFGAGRYTLATNNVPLLKELYKLPTGGNEVFHSEIYFINLVTQMGIKWGTDSKVRLFDPVSGLHLEIGACGEFNIRVNNSRKLLLKLIGTAKSFTQNELLGSDYRTSTMVGKFKALVMNKVKSLLGKVIRERDINILEVDEYISDISQVMKEKINEVLDEYGLIMPEFFITTILTPDDDPNFRRMKEQYAERYLKVQQERILKDEAEAAQARKILEAQTLAQQEIIAAQAKAEAYRLKAEAEAKEMQMKGYTYQQETQREVAKAAVTNIPSGGSGGGSEVAGMVGSMVNLGVGLGVMGEVIGTVKGAVNPVVGEAASMGAGISNAMNPNAWVCTCGNSVTGNFCPNCGNKKPEVKTGWDCACGEKNIKSNFCPNCGSKKPEEKAGWNCACGEKNIKSNFCPNCGSKKPVENAGWDCTCGEKNIKTNFCPNCGSKKPVEEAGWDCSCGEKNIKTNFCPLCGSKKGE